MKNILISFKNVSLTYEVHYDRTNSLKEFIVNLFHRRKYVDHRVGKYDALSDISLDIFEGDRVGVIGKNGAGKSTLLKVIAKILKPTLGEVDILAKVQPLIEISAGFNPEFSGRENIYLNGYMMGFNKEQVQRKENEIIEFADIGEFIDVPIKYYSSGMAVRLAFSIATSIEPEILVVDEMLSAGDVTYIKKAQARMRTLIGKAKALVVVSHDLALVQSLTTKSIVLQSGKVVFSGPTEEAIQYYLRSTENG